MTSLKPLIGRSILARVHAYLSLVVSLLLVGCSNDTRTSDADFSKIRTVSAYYAAYCSEHGGKTPPDEQAFRDYLSSRKTELEQAGLSVDAMFLSPRNQVKLQWVYGRIPPIGPSQMSYVAHEATPSDRSRLVITSRGTYEFIKEDQYQTLFPDSP